MKYNKFKPMTHGLCALAQMMGHPIKKNDIDGAIGLQMEIMQQNGLLYGEMMQDYIIAEEDYWLSRSKSAVIFPENQGVLESLLDGTYDLVDPEAFSLPFDSFVLAMPQGFEVDGVEIPTCLVTWIAAKDHISTVIDGVLEKHRMPPSTIQLLPENVEKTTLAIIAPARDGTHSRVMCYHTLLPKLLGSNTLAHYRKTIGNLSDETISQDLDEYDSKQQFFLLKIVAALGVYTTACGVATCLTKGFPNIRLRSTALPKAIKQTEAFTLRKAQLVEDLTVGDAEELHITQEKADPSANKARWVVQKRKVLSPFDFERDC
jgi:hypothetical protein